MDRTAQHVGFLQRLRFLFRPAVQRDYVLGPARVSDWESSSGVSTETFTPAKYGDYAATSVPVYAAINYRASNLAKVPFPLRRLNRAGETEEVTTGPAAELFAKVNPRWTWNRLMRMTELSLCLWGSAYWMLERGQTGKRAPSEIWWARPDLVTVLPDKQSYIRGFVYDHQGEKLTFTPDEVVWFRYPNPLDEFSGLSPIAAARLSVDAGSAALRSNERLFAQGMNPGGLIVPESADVRIDEAELEAFERAIDKRLKGVDKFHRWMILSAPMKVQAMGMTPKDAEFLGLMKWTLQDVARVYGIPPELLQDHEHATYSNVEQAYKAFWSDVMETEAQFLADEINEQLLPMFGANGLFMAPDFSRIAHMQEDRSEVVAQAQQWFNMGVPLNALLNEFAPNLLPEDGKGWSWGDVGWMSSMLVPATTEEREPPAPERSLPELTQKLLTDAEFLVKAVPEFGSAEHKAMMRAFDDRARPHEKRFTAGMRAIMRAQRDEVLGKLGAEKAILKQGELAEEPFDRETWRKRTRERLGVFMTAAFRAEGERTSREIGRERAIREIKAGPFDSDSPEARAWLLAREQRFAQEVTETTWRQLKDSLAEGLDAGEGIPQLEARVRDVMADRIRSSAETIARTETISAMNEGSLQAAEQSGVVEEKEWLATLDDRTRETHADMHGQRVGIREDFESPSGATARAPGQFGEPEEDINCRCTTVWVTT